MKKKLFVIFTALILAVTFMPAVASAYWSQGWTESGVGNFNSIEAFLVSGSTFANTGLSNFGAGWTGSQINPTYAYASGTIVNSIGFTSEFNTAQSIPLAMDLYAYLNGVEVDSIRFSWSGSGWSYFSVPSGMTYNRSPVPIPAAVWLLGTGLVGLFGVRRRMVS